MDALVLFINTRTVRPRSTTKALPCAVQERKMYIPLLLSLLWVLIVGWFCTRSPGWLARFVNSEILSGTTDIRFRQTQEFVAYLREHPDTWHLRYAVVFRVIRLTGVLAFVIFGIGVLLLIFTQLLQ